MIRILAFAAALAAAMPAAAQKPASTGSAAANITGAWTFQTQTYANGCRMSGQMLIEPAKNGVTHACTFSTEEKCPDIVVKAKEACTATRSAGKLSIKSTVKSVEPQVGYDPDDFDLTIRNGALMTGMMRSFNSAPVEFFRGDAPVS